MKKYSTFILLHLLLNNFQIHIILVHTFIKIQIRKYLSQFHKSNGKSTNVKIITQVTINNCYKFQTEKLSSSVYIRECIQH